MLNKLTVEQLKVKLSSLSLDTRGNKATLIARLRRHTKNKEDDSEGSESLEDGYEDAEELTREVIMPVNDAKTEGDEASTSCRISVKDIDNLVSKFSGDDNLSVKSWFKEFEELSKLMQWCDIEKYIIGKKQLRGSAQSFMRTCVCTSYEDFKAKLSSEFESKVCKADVYNQLQRRRMQKNEKFREYIYKMQEISQLADVDEKSLIFYIINGIPGREEHKVMLYNAKTISELKELYEIHEKYKYKISGTSFGGFGSSSGSSSSFGGSSSNNRSSRPQNQSFLEKNNGRSSSAHCFNCGARDHQRKDCKEETKCFKCNGKGHMSNTCTKNAGYVRKETYSISVPNCKTILINNFSFQALIDTGSQVSLLRENAFKKLGKTQLHNTKIKLVGLESAKSQSIGSFDADVVVDHISFKSPLLVVNNSAISFEAIIGNDIISQAKVVFDKNGPTFHEIEPENLMMQVAIDENSEIEVPLKYAEDIHRRIQNYVPIKTKRCPIEMNILLNDEVPVYTAPRRLPMTEKQVVKQQVETWLNEGVIRYSNSPYCSRVVVVKKKNGSHRVCIDFRKLNIKTIRDSFPFPLIDVVLDNLSDATVFTTLDLKNGYFHVPVAETSKKYTAFVTDDGLFEFNFTPFGLKNAGAVFVRYIQIIFRELVSKKILEVYVDDLIIWAETEEENLRKLDMVLKVAADFNLIFNWPKCRFLQRKVEFLGHVIEKGTVRPSLEKTKAIENFPEPKRVKDIQAFLGLSGFFRRFINGYSLMARPLTDLTRKETKFVFGAPQRQAFTALKNALTNNPLLALYRQDATTEIHTDACQLGIGAVLMQEDNNGKMHPIFYYSKKNSPAEEKMHSYILEVYAVYKACEKFRVYLLGKKFKVVTDCIAFRQTVSKTDLPSSVSRWIMYLQDFDYFVEHRPGKRMTHVDTLSRYPVVYAVQPELLTRLRKNQEGDDFIKSIKEILKQKAYDNFLVKGELLFKEEKGYELLVVPRTMEKEIIKLKHEQGHFGVAKTFALISQEFYIPRLRQKIQSCIDSCVKCILANRKCGKQEGYIEQLDKGEKPLDTLHLDHIGPIDITQKQYKYILTAIDGFSKYTWIFPTKTVAADETLRRLKEQQQVFGNPRRIITDRGSAFTSEVFKSYCRDENIEHILITTGMPRSNGQAERANRVILEVLKRLSAASPEKWYKFVGSVQIAINSTYHRSINRTPFEVLFGVPIRKKEDLEIRELIQQEFTNNFCDNREQIRLDVRQQIEKIQAENKITFNKKRKIPQEYAIGDIVAIKRTQFVTGNKLASLFLGPYEVTSKGRGNRYSVKKCSPSSEGPNITRTSCEFMKPWTNGNEDLSSSESND